MDRDSLAPDAQTWAKEVLGYLNFSSGVEDPRFLAAINNLFEVVGELPKGGRKSLQPAWRRLGALLGGSLDALRGSTEAFRQVDQAEAVVRLVFDEALPGYRQFHRDLLFHQTDETLFGPFFIGRVCEAVLAEGGPWDETDRIVRAAIRRLNDFLGHRPVAVLETDQKLQPYANEWVRPIPLYVQGAGVAVGPYREVIEKALEIIHATDPDLMRQAWFDPAMLEELALDPRAYDFDHPVNKRPNYHFGGWDPHRIDNRGYYRRFVLQQVTLDALSERLATERRLPREQVLFEAAAVLAGTMLMGSGVSGDRPEAHDSTVSLATLLPHVAAYRDAFYEQLIERTPEPHAGRLRKEAKRLRQPFGGARQHLNQALARQRARQLQHVHLAGLFARMGYTDAAIRQAHVVPVASARMRSEIECRLAAAHLSVDRGKLEGAAALVPEVEDLLDRAIHCGALVDPWNMLGFGGQFSLFPAVENSIYDHRVDELIDLMNDVFSLYARLEKEAAAAGRGDLQAKLSDSFRALARWWDQFASTEVGSIQGVSGHEAWESAAQVSEALAAWHRADTAAGDIAFWREHVEQFRSPKAFALLVEALLEKRDLVAAMALLMHWLSQADEIRLAEGDYAFYGLAVRWMEDLWEMGPAGGPDEEPAVAPGDQWPLASKFFDYLEANAEDYWDVPKLELFGPSANHTAEEVEEDADDDDWGGLFAAAYENVSYRDTTDDGFEGEILESGQQDTEFELAEEADRLSERLALLVTVARLWKLVAVASLAGGPPPEERDQRLAGWLNQAMRNRRGLGELLASVHRYPIPNPRSTHDALVEYDRRRGIKEALVERTVAACVEVADAGRFLAATMDRHQPPEGLDDWELPAERVLRAVLRSDAEAVRRDWDELLEGLADRPLLYIPTSRGGNPHRVVASRNLQHVLRRLLAYLPRLGLLSETYELLATVHQMERAHPAGPGAITEFDRLFEAGCRGVVECLVESSDTWRPKGQRPQPRPDRTLIDCMEQAIELLLKRWLSHSRNIRISVLETVGDESRWRVLKEFIQRYGHDLFTQRFMNFGNLRAILHQGVDQYLESLEEGAGADEQPDLLEDLDSVLPREEAERWLELAIEAVVENYPEYIDYNSTTTQSDRGEMLFTLLDFLRLQAGYERLAWNLKPVVIAHEVLVRRGRVRAAEHWREAVAERTGGAADEHLARFEAMCRKYGMRLPSIADRLGERFVRPLDVDRLCALVRPAIEELRHDQGAVSFTMLEMQAARFTEQPSGVGFELPAWLEALESEIERVRVGAAEEDDDPDVPLPVPQAQLPLPVIRRQMEEWEGEE